MTVSRSRQPFKRLDGLVLQYYSCTTAKAIQLKICKLLLIVGANFKNSNEDSFLVKTILVILAYLSSKFSRDNDFATFGA